MSNRKGILFFLVAVAFLIPALLSFAQGSANAPFKIRSIRQQLISPPDYRAMVQGGGNRSANVADKWLKIESEFDSGLDWADDVQLKYYVLLGRGANARVFTGDVTYVNVSRGTRHLSAMFVHPNTIQRYGNGQVEAVAVQLFYRGQLIDQASAPVSSERWWERGGTGGYVVNPSLTPWSIISFDSYEAIKPTP